MKTSLVISGTQVPTWLAFTLGVAAVLYKDYRANRHEPRDRVTPLITIAILSCLTAPGGATGVPETTSLPDITTEGAMGQVPSMARDVSPGGSNSLFLPWLHEGTTSIGISTAPPSVGSRKSTSVFDFLSIKSKLKTGFEVDAANSRDNFQVVGCTGFSILQKMESGLKGFVTDIDTDRSLGKSGENKRKSSWMPTRWGYFAKQVII